MEQSPLRAPGVALRGWTCWIAGVTLVWGSTPYSVESLLWTVVGWVSVGAMWGLCLLIAVEGWIHSERSPLLDGPFIRPWLHALLIALAVVPLLWTGALHRARFALSRPSLERAAAEFEATGALPRPGFYGTYWMRPLEEPCSGSVWFEPALLRPGEFYFERDPQRGGDVGGGSTLHWNRLTGDWFWIYEE